MTLHDTPTPPEQAADLTRSRTRRVAWAFVKAVLFALVLVFVGRYVATHIDRLREHTWRVDFRYLAAAFVAFLLANALQVLVWRVLLRRTTGIGLSVKQSLIACGLSWMGRYVPGKVWYVAGKAVLSAPAAEDRGRVAATATLETLLVQLTGCLLGLAVLPLLFRDSAQPQAALWLVFGLFCVAGLAALYPPLLMSVANPLLRRLKQEPLDLRVPYRSMLLFLLPYAAVWLVYGAGVYATLRAVHPVPLHQLPVIASGFAASAVVGFVSLFAPAGLGVREAVFGSVLAATQWAPGGIIVSVCLTRLVLTAAEAVFAASALALRMGSGRRA